MKRFGVIQGKRRWYIVDYKHGGYILSQWMSRGPAKEAAEIMNRREVTK